MRDPGGAVGPRGATLLLLTAVVGVLLAVHGWAGRQAPVPAGALGGVASLAPASSHPTRPANPATPAGPAGAGPLLRTQSFAQYSYLVWPGTPSAAAKTAMTGLSISAHRAGSGLSVTAGVSGQPGTGHVYPGGARVYVVEATLGDEAGNTDYNLGDDAVVVTDAHGRIVQ